MFRVEVSVKPDLPDPRGEALKADIRDLGIARVQKVRVSDVYWLEGELSPKELELICTQLLADPIVGQYALGHDSPVSAKEAHAIEVAYNPGVMDPVEESVSKGIRDLGVKSLDSVKTAKRYYLWGSLSAGDIELISNKLLVNSVIQHVVSDGERASLPPADYEFSRIEVELLGLDDAGLTKLGRERLELNLEEMRQIQGYFKKLGRNPSDVELETLSQTWSEHCKHKTFNSRIRLGDEVIDNLLKSTIMRVTRELNKPWCLSTFKDNSGVIDFDGRYALCFKVETHNHPSAIEPYGGASTGLGGVIRDPLGTGLGSKPIACTDVFCFAPPDFPHNRLPAGVLHPRRILKGVRAGVADYGNRLGIPTLNGAILFDERYLGNPIVLCGTVGLMPKEAAQMGRQKPGDKVVVVGGRTGRDGIHGVTFASALLTGESEEVSASSVQIGNPITEKKMIDVLLVARDKGLYCRITDCGGGGLSSAVGEMAAETGVRVDLEKVPLKYSGLSYREIWLSESQERMLLAVPPECVEELILLFNSEDVEATVIGEFTDDRKLRLFYHNNAVGDMDMEFLHHGLPQSERVAEWALPGYDEPAFASPPDLSQDLKKILSAWNVCSKEWVIRQYDHEVQGGSVLKPLVGRANDGPGDAAIIRPLLDSDRGVIIANGINPRYGDIDPYWMAASAVDEALRQVIAVGGNLKRVAILDNFNWGNPEKPDRLGGLVRAAQGCYFAALDYGAPFISGKDSLYNEYETEKESICVPPTLLISALAVMTDVTKAVSMDAKKAGDLLYIVGLTYNELGGSHYYAIRGAMGNRVPQVNPKRGKKLMDGLSSAMDKGLVKACHDLSEGGIGVAVAEMGFAGGIGVTLDLKKVPLGEFIDRNDTILFSESNTRFLVEVAPENARSFETAMGASVCAHIGEFNDSDRLQIYGIDGKTVVATPLAELKEAWQKPLRW